jgi:hypothetical protein
MLLMLFVIDNLFRVKILNFGFSNFSDFLHRINIIHTSYYFLFEVNIISISILPKLTVYLDIQLKGV